MAAGVRGHRSFGRLRRWRPNKRGGAESHGVVRNKPNGREGRRGRADATRSARVGRETRYSQRRGVIALPRPPFRWFSVPLRHPTSHPARRVTLAHLGYRASRSLRSASFSQKRLGDTAFSDTSRILSLCLSRERVESPRRVVSCRK